jgi:hypothetical protein
MVFCFVLIIRSSICRPLYADHGIVPVTLVFSVVSDTFFISYRKAFHGENPSGCLIKAIEFFPQRIFNRLAGGCLAACLQALSVSTGK